MIRDSEQVKIYDAYYNKGYKKGYAEGSLSVTEEIRSKVIDDFVKLFDETWETDTSESWVSFVHKVADKVKKGD